MSTANNCAFHILTRQTFDSDSDLHPHLRHNRSIPPPRPVPTQPIPSTPENLGDDDNNNNDFEIDHVPPHELETSPVVVKHTQGISKTQLRLQKFTLPRFRFGVNANVNTNANANRNEYISPAATLFFAVDGVPSVLSTPVDATLRHLRNKDITTYKDRIKLREFSTRKCWLFLCLPLEEAYRRYVVREFVSVSGTFVVDLPLERTGDHR